MDFESVKTFFEKDSFAKACGIEIIEVEEDKAQCAFDITPKHLNAGGTVQGGAIFTLGDFTFAVAANSHGKKAVSLDSQISFMHMAKGKRLIATAYQQAEASKVCFYRVDIEDELKRPVASMSITGYYL